MGTDKKTASRRLIHNAIPQAVYGEDPLSVHLVSMACYDLLREYAHAKGIELDSNPLNKVPEHVRKQVVDVVKRPYRFLKHSKSDADETLDEAEAIPFYDIVILMVIDMHKECFAEETDHMALFSAFVMIRNPKILQPSAWEQVHVSAKDLERLAVQKRSEGIGTLREFFETHPMLIAERDADLATLNLTHDFVPHDKPRQMH